MGASIGQPMEGHDHGITSIAFSPDGKQIASGSEDKTIQLWNVETGAQIGQPMEGHHGPISSITFSPDGKQIASGSQDWSV
jgi:WD40 repeat protein